MTDTASRPGTVRPRWLLPAVAVVLVAFAIPYSRKALDRRSAFDRWQPQVLDLGRGVDIAARHNYPNPPIMALILYPLARLPEVAANLGMHPDTGVMAAALAWYLIKSALTLLAFRWLFTLIAPRDRPFPPWACVVAAVLSLRPILSDLQHGNINLFILFLVTASLVAYVRGRDLLAGIVMGLAVACKVTPALFLPYFVWKRAWTTLAGCVVGLALFLWPGVVPSALLGVGRNHQLLASWYQRMVYPYVIEGRVTSEHNNQSLPGLAARMLTHSASFSTYVGPRYTGTRYDNVLDLDPRFAQWLVKGCMAAFGLLVVWACRTPPGQRQGWRVWAEFGMVVLGMLLFSERTWKHHCVTLAVPFAVVCYYLAACRPGRALRAYLVATLAVATLFIGATSSGVVEERDVQKGVSTLFAKQAQVYGAFVLADVVLLAALVVLLRRTDTTVDAAAAALERKNPVMPAQARAA
jgi:hypothetical protein